MLAAESVLFPRGPFVLSVGGCLWKGYFLRLRGFCVERGPLLGALGTLAVLVRGHPCSEHFRSGSSSSSVRTVAFRGLWDVRDSRYGCLNYEERFGFSRDGPGFRSFLTKFPVFRCFHLTS